MDRIAAKPRGVRASGLCGFARGFHAIDVVPGIRPSICLLGDDAGRVRGVRVKAADSRFLLLRGCKEPITQHKTDAARRERARRT